MEEEKRSTHGEINRHDALCCPQSDTASSQTGLIKISVIAPNNEFEYEHFIEWCASRAELSGLLESLRHYDAIDCKVSLADYAEPEHDIDHIAGISQCVVYIPHNENFYYGTTEEATERILEYCYETGIPMPTKIDYVINGYYVRWKFKTGFSKNELPIWEFVQRALHDRFAGIGADPSVIQDATSMLYAPGFRNSDYVDFDLSEEVLTVHNNAVQYRSPYDFVISLPLNVSEATEYRNIRTKKFFTQVIECSLPQAHQSKRSEESLSKDYNTARIKLLSDSLSAALKIEGCGEGCYRYRQYKAEDKANGNTGGKPNKGKPNEGKPKLRKKFYDWLEVNSTSNQYGLKADRDNWLSAALFGEMYNPYSGQDALRKEEKYAVSVDCNFVILKWAKSELDFIPTPEQGKELVLSHCREIGLPEPRITYTADGLEVKWYWRDRMTKDHPDGNWFNHDWDRMQEELFKKFWYLGAIENGILTMFRVPGSLNTAKKLKTDDRVVRDIHEGEIVSSYSDIQRILGVTPSEPARVNPEEALRQEWETFSREHGGLVQDWMREVLRLHPTTSRNWVCVGSIQGGKWKPHYTQACDLPRYLMRLAGTPEFSQHDLYVSQGEFLRYGDRKVSNLAEIRVNFVDLDYKLLKQYHPEITENPTAEEWKELVAKFVAEHVIPCQNVTVFTGGGVHLKWIYSNAATSADLETWQYVQKLLLEQFRTLGADPASVDAARVLRLTGTQNQKANPEILDRKVRVISAESHPERKITLAGLIEELEASKPANPEVFNALVAEWRKRPPEQPKAEAKIIRLEACAESPVVPEHTEADWMKTILRRKTNKRTYLRVKIGDYPEQIVETRQLRELLRIYYGTPNVKVSLSELISANVKASPAYIPSNYVVLTQCPGATFEEQKENIFRRCDEYREVCIPRPNQIVRIGSMLLVEWKYSSRLPGYALARWIVTQEFICRHFEDWGAMESPDYLTESVLLPVAGFEYENGETASLEYIAAKREYTFDFLARAVLNFSQEEVRKYEELKRKEKAAREAFRKLSKELSTSMAITKAGQGKFGLMAYKRIQDIMTLLELRKDENGEIQQGTRELCIFWMLVFARQAGLVTTEEEFRETAQRFIEICGEGFQTECKVETVMSAFRKIYRAKTTTLIDQLQITPSEQGQMKVLIITKDGKKRQPRKEWLEEHDQERREPWIALGISRATYFRWKKSGKLPGQVRVYDPIPQVEEKNETGVSYIMIAAFYRGGIVMLGRYLEYESVRFVQEGVPDGGYIGLRRLIGLRGLVVKSKLHMKRRRRSRPRRKRKRG